MKRLRSYIFLVCKVQRCGFALISLCAMYLCLPMRGRLAFPAIADDLIQV